MACVSDRPFSEDPVVNARPYLSAAPDNYDGSPKPLIVTLHGFGEDGLLQGTRSGLQSMVNERDFILVAPDGEELVPDERGWSISCCNETFRQSDDVAYLRAVIADISKRYNVDPTRIYVTGFSNGGFMAYLMACEASDLIAAVSVQAGTVISEELAQCVPTEPVAIRHSQGTADEDVLYDGGSLDYGLGPINYISAQEAVDHWREINGCTADFTTETVDADTKVAGEETEVQLYSTCTSNLEVEFWKMNESGHFVSQTEAYLKAEIDFLFAHQK